MKNIVRINEKLQRVEVTGLEIENQIVFNFFSNIPVENRTDMFTRALYIGVLALKEDRFSAFLSKTSNELGTELENLKMIFDLKQELFFKTAVKGNLAEDEIAEELEGYILNRGYQDSIILTGTERGKLIGNKTGDILSFIDGDETKKLTIECKFDKSVKLGDVNSKDIANKIKTDTAWSQLLEAQVNREANIAMIVFDKALVDSSILKGVENITFVKGIGFICIIDSQKGDFINLFIAYNLARNYILNNCPEQNIDNEYLKILIRRFIKDIEEIKQIKRLVEVNIENNKNILKQLEKSILSVEFNQMYLNKFLTDGKISKADLLSFYQRDEIATKYKEISLEINAE